MAAERLRRVRPSRWSARLRLTAAAALVIAAALSAAGYLTVAELRGQLLSAIDTAAHDDAVDVAASPSNGGSRLIEPPTPDAAVQVLDAVGAVVARSGNAPPQALVPVDRSVRSTIVATGPLHLPNPADAYYVEVLRRPRSGITVIVALPSDDVSDTVRRLDHVLLVGLPLLFLLLVSLAVLVIGRALAPMTSLARRQREFVSDAAHELRTPLAGLLAQLELLGSDAESDARRGLPRLRAEVERIQSLVDSLLALVGATDHAPRLREVDLDDVVLASVQRYRDRIVASAGSSRPAVELVTLNAVRVMGDRTALTRLVDNLLDNASRYAVVRIDVSLTVDRSAGVLTVADDGPGIPAADRERVFGRFTRLDDGRSRAAGGAGLGLAIVRAVADAHGGTVIVAYQPPRAGAVLVVRLPLADSSLARTRPGLISPR